MDIKFSRTALSAAACAVLLASTVSCSHGPETYVPDEYDVVEDHLSHMTIEQKVGQLVITTCLQIPSAIFLEAFLSFLGLGVSAPMASLGSLCSDALETLSLYPYRLIFPGVILTVVVLTLNLVGDGLRDALDPRLKK